MYETIGRNINICPQSQVLTPEKKQLLDTTQVYTTIDHFY